MSVIGLIEFFFAITFIIATIGVVLGSISLTRNTTPSDATILQAQLQGFEPLTGSVSAQDSILSAFGKVSTSSSETTIVEANGFAAATGPDLTLSLTLNSGLLAAGSQGQVLSASNQDVTGSLLTGYVSGAGTVSASDSILEGIQKLNGNITSNTTTVTATNGFGAATGPALTLTVTPSGLLKGNAGAVAAAAATDVTGQLLTGYVSGAGTVAASDSILQGIQKLNGNDANKMPLSGGTFSGDVDMGTHDITNLSNLNSIPVTDFITTTSVSPVLGDIPVFSGTGVAVQNSNVSLSSLATTESLDNYISQGTLAPPGLRDLWQTAPTSNTGGPQIVSSDGLGIVLMAGNFVNVAKYSTDGGITWTSCILDVAASVTLIPGISDTQALLFGDSVWTSPDGINFTKQPTPPSVNWTSGPAHWFSAAGVWIMGVNASPTQQLATSPDGITWTLRNSTVDVSAFADNGSICVAVGEFIAPHFQWSNDGTTWTNVVSTITPSRCICYNSTKLEFLSLGFGSGAGHTWQSTDGKIWNDRGAGTAPTTAGVGQGLFWVPTFLRYYASGADSNTNYSLWSTEDSTIPFVGTHLDGATVNPLNYSGLYLTAYNRFLIGINIPPYVAYSTVRNDVKALTDNIRVRNAPVATSQYVSYSDFTINNTAALTPIVPVSANGTLFYQDSQPFGMAFKIRVNLLLTSSAGDTFTVGFLVDGTLKWSHIITVPATSVNLVSKVSATAVVRSGNLSVNSFAWAGIVPQNTFGGLVTYTSNAAHTWSLTGQWGAAVNQATVQDILFSNFFRNGA
jgi:hypothetical protein